MQWTFFSFPLKKFCLYMQHHNLVLNLQLKILKYGMQITSIFRKTNFIFKFVNQIINKLVFLT